MTLKELRNHRSHVALAEAVWIPNQKFALVLIQDLQTRPAGVVVSMLDPQQDGDNTRVLHPDDIIGIVDLAMVTAAARLFSYSWADINFEYDQLTDREQRAMPSVDVFTRWMKLVETV